jgi:Ras-related protein Rab-7A
LRKPGNKADKENERKVPQDKAKTWCKNHGDIHYFEVSAKDDINVADAFLQIAKAASTREKEDEM